MICETKYLKPQLNVIKLWGYHYSECIQQQVITLEAIILLFVDYQSVSLHDED